MPLERVALIVPVRNGGAVWRAAAAAIRAQVPQPDRVLVIDSASSDGSDEVAVRYGFELRRIDPQDFDHGGTRQMAAELCADYGLLVYLTQDAVLADPGALQALVDAFENPQIAVAYGRQLPRPQARAIEAHARLFNYPPTSQTRSLDDRRRLGLKAAFASDSFCAYRRSALFAVGGFPRPVIVAEDMIVAARVLQAGHAVAYVAGARVLHSHAYSLRQEFQRYFDTGVLHGQQPWLLQQFGAAEGEGLRFVRSELRHLLRHAPWWIPAASLRTLGKWLGYRLGRRYQRLPAAWLPRLSMHPGYWRKS